MEGSGGDGSVEFDRKPALQFGIDRPDPAKVDLHLIGLAKAPSLQKEIESLAHIGIADAEDERFVCADAQFPTYPRRGPRIRLQ